VATVTNAEVDKAFYDSYRDPSGNLDPRLTDSKGQPRKLGNGPADAQFRREWSKIRKDLQEKKGCAPSSGGTPVGSVISGCPTTAPAANPDGPKFEPNKWNDATPPTPATASTPATPGSPGPIQNSTNCYAYALDSRTGHPAGGKPQPGVASAGSTAASNSCADVTAATLSDGAPALPGDPPRVMQAPQCPYQVKNKLPPPAKKGYYLVALVTTSITSEQRDLSTTPPTFHEPDYHWYRQDSDGLWSHKPGHDTVQRVDSNGVSVTNPQTAAKVSKETVSVRTSSGPVNINVVTDYDKFCGYFYVKKGGSTTKP